MGAIAVTAEILSIGITEVRRSLKPNELGQHQHRQPAENLRFSKVYSRHPPLLGPINESETDETGCLNIKTF